MDTNRYQMLDLDKRDGVLTITMCNPARKNAVNRAMHAELERIWDDVDADKEVRVAVLVGFGEDFCAGIDLNDQKAMSDSGRKGRPRTRAARRLFWSMIDCEKPIIAKVRGVAYGLGLSIALASDIVVAEDSARLCDSHVRVGITPGDGGAALIPLLIGFHRAKEFLMTGEPITGQRAAQIGLVNHAVPEQQLDALVEDIAQKLAAGAPLAISYAKLAVNTMLKQMAAGSFETSMAYDQLTLFTDDHIEGARAFLEKRKPKFSGS